MANETEQGSRPVPDPTVLTTEALLREIKGLRELLVEKIERVNDRITLLDDQRRAEKENVKEQLAQITTANQTAVESLRRETGDLKDRVGRVEFGPTPPA